jgi:ABC-type multidrug transport system fused ATPase/permease subunit
MFDDRIDLETNLSTTAVFAIVGRCLKMIAGVKWLFGTRAVLGIFALIPATITPWVGKIVVDQVILSQPVVDAEVRFPPHMAAFVNAIRDLAPMDIMLAVSVLVAVMIVLMGSSGLFAALPEGQDSATKSENKLNGGGEGSGAGGLLGALEVLVNIRLTQRIANGLRTQLFDRLSRLPMSILDDHRIGDSVYRVMYDTPEVPSICTSLTLGPIYTVLSVAVSLWMMQYSYGSVAPELVWGAALIIPITLLLTLPLTGVARRVGQASRASGTATTNAIEESMSNIHAVQSLGGMEHEKARIETKSGESFRRFRHVVSVQILIGAVSLTLTVAFGVYATNVVVHQIIAGTMTAGDFFVLFGIALSLGGAGIGLGAFWVGIQESVAAVRRVFFFMDIESEDPSTDLPDLPVVKHSVRLEDVSLDYPNGHNALRHISLEFKLGEVTAIVGPTGAGKSSLAYLIPRYYDATSGRVLFDGQDANDVNLESLRSQVSYVFQEHLLLSESIRSNLLIANREASEEEMLQACETAGAMSFIRELPEGLDTLLGQSGDTLSVGQKQRMCIARGLVRNTPILILDEPTAALDPQTENALVRALQAAAVDRLVIIIAHRLSTIRGAQHIVFLEDGEVKSEGSHDALMEDKDGAYSRFVALQSGADLGAPGKSAE